MYMQQYISEFNLQASSIKFMSYTDEIVLTNKLKAIQAQFADVDLLESDETDKLFTNIYHLLCQSSDMKAELLDNCLDILLKSINSSNEKIRTKILCDFRFLSVLIGNIMNLDEGEDKVLVKLLTIIRELLSWSSELDEHTLKLIVEVLRDYSLDQPNEDVSIISLHILSNLCFDNCAAKYLITKAMKATEVRNKINNLQDNLIKFKFVILLEDEIYSKDVRYFLNISLADIRKSTKDFSQDVIKSSLDILKHIEKLEIQLDFKLSDDEQIVKLLSDLNVELVAKIAESADSPAKTNFFERIFKYFNVLLSLDPDLTKEFENLVEAAFVTAKISRSASALTFLTEFLKNNGELNSSEIIIDSLLEFYAERNPDTQIEAIDHSQVSFIYSPTIKPL